MIGRAVTDACIPVAEAMVVAGLHGATAFAGLRFGDTIALYDGNHNGYISGGGFVDGKLYLESMVRQLGVDLETGEPISNSPPDSTVPPSAGPHNMHRFTDSAGGSPSLAIPPNLRDCRFEVRAHHRLAPRTSCRRPRSSDFDF